MVDEIAAAVADELRQGVAHPAADPGDARSGGLRQRGGAGAKAAGNSGESAGAGGGAGERDAVGGGRHVADRADDEKWGWILGLIFVFLAVVLPAVAMYSAAPVSAS